VPERYSSPCLLGMAVGSLGARVSLGELLVKGANGGIAETETNRVSRYERQHDLGIPPGTIGPGDLHVVDVFNFSHAAHVEMLRRLEFIGQGG
jgi:hypothetical protein